ncbi:PIN-like domain-containing protein [Pedococcus ginsenosidimutans]|uniref:PIN-like domain-containing protein n=1 Tax=Pedococcus ginsenosidimutans TaxID=490570 RepID=UPI0031EEF611
MLSSVEISAALQAGILALDTNVLLNLYRYNEKTVDDLLSVAEAAGDRLYVPHQVLREFWRNRQSVIASLGSATKDAHGALTKNATSTSDAISRWAKSVALPEDQRQSLLTEVQDFYVELKDRVGDEPTQLLGHAPTARDVLLARLEVLLDGRVGPPLADDEWKKAVAEGERRVENSIPPGYMDVEKLESDLPEGASGDYLVWHQLLLEGTVRKVDLVLVTSDTKEDWWNRAERGAIIGARRELIQEYLESTGCRFFLLEPADLIKHSSALGVGTSIESVQDIERVRDEEPEIEPWTLDSVRMVLRDLDAQGYVQAQVIREAIGNGGRVSRARVYALDNRDESQMLRGFTRPVSRVTAELQARGAVPYGLPPLLGAGYESGVKSSHFTVPHEVVQLFDEDAREG